MPIQFHMTKTQVVFILKCSANEGKVHLLHGLKKKTKQSGHDMANFTIRKKVAISLWDRPFKLSSKSRTCTLGRF